MEALGKHLLVELSGCNYDLMLNIEYIRQIITQGALEANAEIREVALHKFSPQGISGVVIIAESHLSIHTWPEYQYVAIDIYTCGLHTKPKKACQYLADKLKAKNIDILEIQRGIKKANNIFTQKIIKTD